MTGAWQTSNEILQGRRTFDTVSVKPARQSISVRDCGDSGAAPDRDGISDYPISAIDQVRFILSAQSEGLSLRVIGGIIRLRSEGVTPCQHVEGLLKERLEEIDLRMDALQRARREVSEQLARARNFPRECDESSVCHLIATVP
jgi:DNA-binding transcriptional MerR regulator